MGIITRHASAPFVDGETLAGADLENDFATIYDEFNGGISAANLASNAVTTAKINNGAVTLAKLSDEAIPQEKLEDGAATASESKFSAGPLSPTTSFATIGNTITHDVGDPARHVILHWSVQAVDTLSRTYEFQILKDSVLLTGSDVVLDASGDTPICFMSVDASPTAGGTHIYELQAKVSSTSGSPTLTNLTFVAFEPRS